MLQEAGDDLAVGQRFAVDERGFRDQFAAEQTLQRAQQSAIEAALVFRDRLTAEHGAAFVGVVEHRGRDRVLVLVERNQCAMRAETGDRKSTRLNYSHSCASRMPSSA